MAKPEEIKEQKYQEAKRIFNSPASTRKGLYLEGVHIYGHDHEVVGLIEEHEEKLRTVITYDSAIRIEQIINALDLRAFCIENNVPFREALSIHAYMGDFEQSRRKTIEHLKKTAGRLNDLASRLEQATTKEEPIGNIDLETRRS